MDQGRRHGVYGDLGEATMHRLPGAESYYVLRHTCYFLTLGTPHHRPTPLISEEPVIVACSSRTDHELRTSGCLSA